MNVKRDCFGFTETYRYGHKYETCKVLKALYCENENCKFYKEAEVYKKQLQEQKEREVESYGFY